MKREIVTRYVVDVPVRLADVLISDMKTGTKRKKKQSRNLKSVFCGGRKPYADSQLID